MSIVSIRKMRGVPAKRGMRVFYRHAKKHGTIRSARGGNLRILLDGDRHAGNFHPCWQLDYLDKDGNVIYSSKD